MPEPLRASRSRRTWEVLGVVASYGSGLGTIALSLFIFGVRPDNFAAWLVSPVGLILIGGGALIALWRYRHQRR